MRADQRAKIKPDFRESTTKLTSTPETNPRFGSDAEVNSVPHSWHGEMVHLWRAVDQAGQVFESFVTKDRDKPAAQTLIEKTKYVGGRDDRCRTGNSLDHVVRLERAVHVGLRLDLDGGMAD